MTKVKCEDCRFYSHTYGVMAFRGKGHCKKKGEFVISNIEGCSDYK